MEPIRIGVVGLKFGQYHVRTLAHMDDVRLVAVADRQADVSPGGREAYARRYGAKAYASCEEMLEREDLDAVSVCVSPKWRAEIIEQVARRGIPMFVEKPWASTLQHARALAEVCQRYNATVMVGFSFRYHPAIVRLRELIDGELGAGWLLNGEYIFDYLPPADGWLWDPNNGNGLFNENACHLFDSVTYLLGQPVSVMAEAVNFTGSPSEEAAAISISFASGAVAALTVGGYGANAHWDFPRIDIATAHGQARLKGRHHMWESLTWARRDSSETQTFLQPPEMLGSTRYTHAMTHFFDCVRNETQPTATIEDGITAVALAEAVYASARTGMKVPVQV